MSGDSGTWLTLPYDRRVLVVVRTITTLNRLLDVLTLFENDHRVQVVFTVDEARPAILGAGVPALLEQLKMPVVSWDQAVQLPFELVIAASENDDLHLLKAPVVLLSHGVGFQKYYPGTTVVAGMDPDRLIRDGRVVAELIAVSRQDEIEQIHRVSPAAADHARVVGDPCLDRLLASRHLRPTYRRALDAADRTLVTIASTWGPASLLGAHPDLPLRVVSELPVDEFAVCLVTHPGITAAHGSWQLDTWLAEARRAGLRVIPPESGWQTAIIAADCVLTDTGSVGTYAAALARPSLLADGHPETILAGSPAAVLADQTARLDLSADIAPQIRTAIGSRSPYGAEADHPAAEVIGRIVDVPEQSAVLLRRAFYELLSLPEPGTQAEFALHPPYAASGSAGTAFVIGATVSGATTTIVRLPTSTTERQLDQQHIAAAATGASLRQLSGASIIFTDLHTPSTFLSWAKSILACWPDAELAAARGHGRCLVHTRDGASYALTADDPMLDPLLTATLVLLGRTGAEEFVIVGDRRIRVTTETV
ncbi:hypothetical protein [Kribbella albertanoniae]|uniref:Uncharacterized protein n=1 Tax=Kribbella albertanoniae TaxID=1266829 RepID=A0A4V2XQI3_9ACTN|nr:hypothetical protein [Kribbella albertanoniae]TDC26195.1 hypothetical protein E1261_22855 [Kribbella albertanoniae]